MHLGRILVVLALVCPLAVAVEALVTIRPLTELPLPRATLGDVADIVAEEATTARLAAIPVAELATLTPQLVDGRLVRALATRAAAPAVLRVEGSGTVSRRARAFATADLAAAAAAILPADATWELVRAGAGITAPDSADLRLVAEPLDPTAVGDVPYRVRAMAGPVEQGRSLVVLRVARWAGIVVATRAISRGQVVGPGDLAIERRAVDRANLMAVGLAPDRLAGRVASRDLAAGAVITPDLLLVAPVIRAGAAVAAVWQGRGFAVELATTALGDARAGDRINLRRSSDGTVLHGTAQADGTAVIER
jgi:flagella basal body P-ring formation protein FlgA